MDRRKPLPSALTPAKRATGDKIDVLSTAEAIDAAVGDAYVPSDGASTGGGLPLPQHVTFRDVEAREATLPPTPWQPALPSSILRRHIPLTDEDGPLALDAPQPSFRIFEQEAAAQQGVAAVVSADTPLQRYAVLRSPQVEGSEAPSSVAALSSSVSVNARGSVPSSTTPSAFESSLPAPLPSVFGVRPRTRAEMRAQAEEAAREAQRGGGGSPYRRLSANTPASPFGGRSTGVMGIRAPNGQYIAHNPALRDPVTGIPLDTVAVDRSVAQYLRARGLPIPEEALIAEQLYGAPKEHSFEAIDPSVERQRTAIVRRTEEALRALVPNAKLAPSSSARRSSRRLRESGEAANDLNASVVAPLSSVAAPVAPRLHTTEDRLSSPERATERFPESSVPKALAVEVVAAERPLVDVSVLAGLPARHRGARTERPVFGEQQDETANNANDTGNLKKKIAGSLLQGALSTSPSTAIAPRRSDFAFAGNEEERPLPAEIEALVSGADDGSAALFGTQPASQSLTDDQADEAPLETSGRLTRTAATEARDALGGSREIAGTLQKSAALTQASPLTTHPGEVPQREETAYRDTPSSASALVSASATAPLSSPPAAAARKKASGRVEDVRVALVAQGESIARLFSDSLSSPSAQQQTLQAPETYRAEDGFGGSFDNVTAAPEEPAVPMSRAEFERLQASRVEERLYAARAARFASASAVAMAAEKRRTATRGEGARPADSRRRVLDGSEFSAVRSAWWEVSRAEETISSEAPRLDPVAAHREERQAQEREALAAATRVRERMDHEEKMRRYVEDNNRRQEQRTVEIVEGVLRRYLTDRL